jgi:DNA-binding CsgD family transcriptional regulator
MGQSLMPHNSTAVIEDYIQKLLTCESKQDITNTLQSAASFLDFDYFAYGTRRRVPVTSPKIEVINNYSAEWNDLYLKQGLSQKDPLIELAIKSKGCIYWDELTSESDDFWQQASLYGIDTGWSKPTHFPNGVVSLFSFSRGPSATSYEEIQAKMPHLIWLSSIADQCMEKVLQPEIIATDEVHLTSREIELLKWTADGKTMAEISMIVGISARTAEFHITNASKKLGCPNKTAATVKAALLGLI